MKCPASQWSKMVSVAVIAGVAGAGLVYAGAARANVVIDNFSQDTVGTTPTEVGAWNGQALSIVSSGTADGNMLQVSIPANSQYYAGLQFQTPGFTAANWAAYQDISFDILFPNTTGSTLYPGNNLTLGAMGWQGSAGSSDPNLSPSVNISIPATSPNTTLISETIPLAGITAPASGQSYLQFLLNAFPAYNQGTTGPWAFDIGNIQFTNPVSTPEPASLAVIGLGGAALLMVGRRRRTA